MRIGKFTALLLALCMMTALLPAGLLTGNADDVYIVTLDPGNGGGEPIVYRSDEQAEFPSWRDARNAQFYLEDNGRLGFYLSDDYCPASFSAPENCSFSGWNENARYNVLTSRETTFTANWEAAEASFRLFAAKQNLNAGYTSITIVAMELYKGELRINGSPSGLTGTSLFVSFSSGTMTCGENVIPFEVFAEDYYGDGLSVSHFFYSQGDTMRFYLYVDPDVYASAPEGTYEGELYYTTVWNTTGTATVDGPGGSFHVVMYRTATSFTVTFDPQGGTVDPAQMTTNADYKLSSLPTPEYDGKTFLGWFGAPVNGNRITTDTVFQLDQTVYAHWFDPEEIVFDMPQSLTIDSAFTALTADISTLVFEQQPSGETPNRLRVIFTAGTLTNADGTATIPYKLNDREIADYARNMLYADWTAAENPQTVYIYVSDEDIEAAGPGVYTGEVGYTVRWYFENSGWSSDMLTWTVPLSLTVVEQVYTVTFDAQGGTVDPAEMTTSLYKLQSLPTPERENREFLGWFTEAEGGEEITVDTVFDADATVYAHWRVPGGFILDLPEAVTLTDSLWNEIQVDIEALEFYEQPNGKTPYRMRVIFTAGTLISADGTVSIPYKLNVEEDEEWVSNQKMRDWTAAGNPRTIYIYMSDAVREAAGPGVYTGTMTYIARWGYENNGWSGDILTGTIPVTLTIPEKTSPFDVNNDGTVTVGDVSALLDHIAAGDTTDLSLDLDGDGTVTVSDVSALLDYLAVNA